LQAISGKLQMSSDVDLDMLAKGTNGLSGADLQALVYNAHLDVVHSSISATGINTAKKNLVNGNVKTCGGERKYRQIAPPIQESSVSNAEKAELGDRVS
jgi:peroxin-1